MRWMLVVLVACSSSPHAALPVAGPVPFQPAVADPEPVAPDPQPALRLPTNVHPTRARLELTIVPPLERAEGQIHFDAAVTAATHTVWLNAKGLDVHHATLAGRPARVIPGGDDFVGLVSDRELGVGPLAIDVAFGATIDHDKSRGIYAQREPDGTDYVYTFFEPTDARRAFPCFDEPNAKIPWQLIFHVRRDHVALGNAPVAHESDETDGMKRVELAESRPLPSYLVAFVVGPFDVIDDGVAGRVKTPIRFVTPKGRAGELGWAKDVTPRVVAALESYFDMDYPYGKLDVAVVPRYWGTMEHPGIVAMGQSLTLIRPEQATRDRKEGYANILAHELSHYWFGDLVTMAWWNDTWLNEALGEWSDMNITDAVEPGWHYRDDRVHFAIAGMEADEAVSVHAIRQPVTTASAIQASFDNDITYFKGSSVLRMFEAFAGADAWRTMIRGYLKAHAFGNATSDDLIAAMRDQLGAPIADGFRSFIEQPGVPRIGAELDCKAKQLVLHQSRSLHAGDVAPPGPPWQVPVCVRYGDATHAERACTLLTGADGTLPIARCPTWLLLNADATGYYRSANDPATARALLTPGSPLARVAKLTVAEKLMTIRDVRAAVDRGELTLDRALSLAPIVARDPDDKVALSAYAAATFPAAGLPPELHTAGRHWLVRTFSPPARALGWHRRPTDTDDRQALRRAVVPLAAYEDAKLEAEGTKLAERWLVDRSGLDDDLVNSALQTAARHGDAARFARFVAAAKAARDRAEQGRILAALGGFQDPALAAQALAIVQGHDFDLRDTMSIVYRLMFTYEMRDLAWTWLVAHLDELLGRMRSDEAAGFLGAIAADACTAEQRRATGELLGTRAKAIDGADNEVTRGLEQSDHCIASVARDLPALRTVFR